MYLVVPPLNHEYCANAILMMRSKQATNKKKCTQSEGEA
jgi:hypothetical protein